MEHVIIGAGPAGVIAAETLRKAQPDAAITIIGDELETPYSRMALPYYLVNKISEEGMYLRKRRDHYRERNIQLRHSRASALDRGAKQLTLSDGGTVNYDKLLIATGAQPVAPPIAGIDDLPNVHTCWTVADGRAIAAKAQPNTHVVLLGAGFIGCIILEALVHRGVLLTVVEMDDRMVPRMMDHAAAAMLRQWCQSKGVTVQVSTRIEAIEANATGTLSLRSANGDTITADMVIQATGVKPRLDFLDGSGLAHGYGIRVNDQLRTNDPDIYAAGDVAEGKDFSTGGYAVQAIQPTAVEHGRIAGINMAAGAVRHPGSVNMNVLDTIGLISCSFGLWDGVDGGACAVLEDRRRYRYLNLQFQDDRLVGASSLGLTDHVGVIRGIIQSRMRLGVWAKRLQDNPTRLMEAYIARTQAIGGNANAFAQAALAH